jgi:hypothetical protein
MNTVTPLDAGLITGSASPLLAHEKSRLRAAARHARRLYPDELGELVFRELTAYAEFGIRFSVDALIPRLATRILATQNDDGGGDVTSIAVHRPAPDQLAAS